MLWWWHQLETCPHLNPTSDSKFSSAFSFYWIESKIFLSEIKVRTVREWRTCRLCTNQLKALVRFTGVPSNPAGQVHRWGQVLQYNQGWELSSYIRRILTLFLRCTPAHSSTFCMNSKLSTGSVVRLFFINLRWHSLKTRSINDHPRRGFLSFLQLCSNLCWKGHMWRT